MEEGKIKTNLYLDVGDNHEAKLETINNYANFVKSIFPDATFKLEAKTGSILICLGVCFGCRVLWKIAKYAIDKKQETDKYAIDRNIEPSPFVNISALGCNNNILANNVLQEANKMTENDFAKIKQDVNDEKEIKAINNFAKSTNNFRNSIRSEKPKSAKFNDEDANFILNDKCLLQEFDMQNAKSDGIIKTQAQIDEFNITYDGKPHISLSKNTEQNLMNSNNAIKEKIKILKEEYDKQIKQNIENEKQKIKDQNPKKTLFDYQNPKKTLFD